MASIALPFKFAGVALVAAMLIGGCSSHSGPKTTSDKSADTSHGPRAFQLTYSCPNNFAYQTQHIYSDGAGHVRMDIMGKAPAATVVNVADLNNNQTTAWAEGTGKFARASSQPTDPVIMWVRTIQMTIPSDTQSLGTKDIASHHCHGWKSGFGTEIWYDDDYHIPVLTTSGDITSTLTEFSAQAPDPSVFQPPSGFLDASPPDTGESRNRSALRTRRQSGLRALHDAQRFMH